LGLGEIDPDVPTSLPKVVRDSLPTTFEAKKDNSTLKWRIKHTCNILYFKINLKSRLILEVSNHFLTVMLFILIEIFFEYISPYFCLSAQKKQPLREKKARRTFISAVHALIFLDVVVVDALLLVPDVPHPRGSIVNYSKSKIKIQ